MYALYNELSEEYICVHCSVDHFEDCLDMSLVSSKTIIDKSFNMLISFNASYLNYLLESHARKPHWKVVGDYINEVPNLSEFKVVKLSNMLLK